MRAIPSLILTLALAGSAPALSFAEQDVPHQQPDTNNPDVGKQRKPADGGQKSQGSNDPTRNNPDVPHQEPGTDNPDVGKQRHPTPGGTTDTQKSKSTRQAKGKPKPKNQNTTDSPK